MSKIFQNTRGQDEWLENERAKRVQTEPGEDTIDRKLAALNPFKSLRTIDDNNGQTKEKENEKVKNYRSDFATISTAQKNHFV